MEKERLQEVSEHAIVDLEQDIYFRNRSPRQQRQELSIVDFIIEELQKNTEQNQDQTEFSVLSRLQQKAYQCRIRVLKRDILFSFLNRNWCCYGKS